MKKKLMLSPFLVLAVSCSTLDQSIKLGALTGAATGVAATYAGYQANGGRSPTPEETATGAAIGLGLGLITSYFIHQQVVTDREDTTKQTEIYFGDLPPSPFVIPQPKLKGGH